MLLNEKSAFLEEVSQGVNNPEKEPYRNEIFEGYKILIVILYLGGYVVDGKIFDNNITEDEFNTKTGEALKTKGFKYDIVYSYEDATNKLTSINEKGKCPYNETWIFCSDGSGNTPKGGKTEYQVTKDKNKETIIPFLKTISEYNIKGGALLLFCDNEPFTFETNLLLKEYLKFEEIEKIKINFEMKGKYNAPNLEDKMIRVYDGKNNKKCGTFSEEIFYGKPGKRERLSLRLGLVEFNEGITLSYAQTFDNSNNYYPFIPFAYLSKKDEEKPFILYYDPKIKENEEFSRGPIIIHGGFTSSFYDFEEEGTGILIISITCWLRRPEENILDEHGIFNIEKKYVPYF